MSTPSPARPFSGTFIGSPCPDGQRLALQRRRPVQDYRDVSRRLVPALHRRVDQKSPIGAHVIRQEPFGTRVEQRNGKRRLEIAARLPRNRHHLSLRAEIEKFLPIVPPTGLVAAPGRYQPL